MRVSADQYRLEDTRWEDVVAVLRQQYEAARQFSPCQAIDGFIPHRERAAISVAQSGERMQKQCLADAVPAQKRDDLSGTETELESLYQSTPGNRNVDALR